MAGRRDLRTSQEDKGGQNSSKGGRPNRAGWAVSDRPTSHPQAATPQWLLHDMGGAQERVALTQLPEPRRETG